MKPIAVALLAILGLAVAGPARASSIPRLPLARGQTAIELGLIDLNLDHAVSDDISLGASASLFQASLAARATQRLWSWPDGGAVGVVYSLGYMPGAFASGLGNLWSPPPVTPGAGPFEPPPDAYWIQPALVVAMPLALPFAPTVRATIGPSFQVQPDPRNGGFAYNLAFGLPLSVELALGGGHPFELVLGGNGILAGRMVF